MRGPWRARCYTWRMPNAWDRLPAETNKAFGAFVDFLQLGPGRTLKALAGAEDYSPTGVRKWSSQHNWTTRATAYDSAELERSIQGREQVRERARQALIDDTEQATATLAGVNRGRLPMPECSEDCTDDVCVCGVWLPILDRHGVHIGRKPAIAPSTRSVAALATLDRCGLTPPKRVELTGADGEQLRIEARLLLGTLGEEQLVALAEAFAPGDDDS